MEFIDEKLNDYCLAHSSPEPTLLTSLSRETHVKVLSPRMLSGHLQGRFLSLLCKMMCASRILEIGTYTGYSAICMAEGLTESGKLYTIDINAELESMVEKYIQLAGMAQQIVYLSGDAKQIIPNIKETFDVVFIDADKLNYALYYDLVFDKVRPGGLIIADNVLWSGKVIAEGKMDKDTKAIDDFNIKVHADVRVEHVLLPVRDGLMVVRKK